MLISVPKPDDQLWPSLGGPLVDLLEERAVHGPGDLKGQPYRLDDEKRALIYRAYEIFPKGHPREGQRRFKNVIFSLRKGSAKTEFGAAISFLELHPESEVRFDGWRREGRTYVPVGRPVVDPYIPMVAYTERQSDELAYRALFTMITEGPDAEFFDAGLDRIIRLDDQGRPDGKAVALAGSPDSNDGARTTFQHFDETHRFTSTRLIAAHESMQQNIPKRVMADPWSLKTTTAFEPGEDSVHESDMALAQDILHGRATDPTFCFFHRQASDTHDLTDPEGLRAAIREASGPSIMGWPNSEAQVENIAALYGQAKRRGNESYVQRVWLNRPTASEQKAFSLDHWKSLAAPRAIAKGAGITIGLDGSRYRDATGIVCTDFLTGYQWKAACWTVTPGEEIPVDEVEQVIDDLYEQYSVARFYFDPAFGWGQGPGQHWEGKHGNTVVRFETGSRSVRKIAEATLAYTQAVSEGLVENDGDDEFAEHIGNAHKYIFKGKFDDEGQPLWSLGKGPGTPPPLMDLAIGGVLSWQARLDAIATGWKPPKKRSKVRVWR